MYLELGDGDLARRQDGSVAHVGQDIHGDLLDLAVHPRVLVTLRVDAPRPLDAAGREHLCATGRRVLHRVRGVVEPLRDPVSRAAAVHAGQDAGFCKGHQVRWSGAIGILGVPLVPDQLGENSSHVVTSSKMISSPESPSWSRFRLSSSPHCLLLMPTILTLLLEWQRVPEP